MRRVGPPWVWLVWLSLLSACSPVYVLRLGYEEARILWHRRPISDVLRRPELDPAVRDKLRLVLRVRAFAEHELGFRVGGSYASLTEVSRPPIIHVLTAAPQTSLEPYTWWFPIVGRVAYKGYFNRALARAEARRLEARGYDTAIRTASAFSTLGWFDDPLLPHLLDYDPETLANVIFHELFHSTFYLTGHTAFNESLANFAGHRPRLSFFAGSTATTTSSPAGPRRAGAGSWSCRRVWPGRPSVWRRCTPRPWPRPTSSAGGKGCSPSSRPSIGLWSGPEHARAGLASGKLNNAVLLNQLVYMRELEVFERVYQNGKDLPAALAAMTGAAENADEPFGGVRALLELARPPVSLPSRPDAAAAG